MELYRWTENGNDYLTTGFLMISQHFSSYGEGISRELEDFDVCVYGLKGLTAGQLSEDKDARLIAHVVFKHDQELGSVLDGRRPFNLLLLICRRMSWSCEWLLS